MTGCRPLLVAYRGHPPDALDQAFAVNSGQVLRRQGCHWNFCCRNAAWARFQPAVMLLHFSTAFRMTSTGSIAVAVIASAVTR